MNPSRLLFPLALVSTLSATASATPYLVTGTVKDAAGRPVPGAQIAVDNTYFDGAELHTVTNSKGQYRIDLKQTLGAWQVVGWVQRTYHGETYRLPLQPDKAAAFGGASGAARNFTWRISGKTPNGGVYGARFYALDGFSSDGEVVERGDLEVTLTPEGPLLDGSPGKPITVRYNAPLNDVPLGRYRVTARSLSGKGPVWVRTRGGTYAASAVVNLTYVAGDGQTLSVDVIRPKGQAAPRAAAPVSSTPTTFQGKVVADIDLKGTLVWACLSLGEGKGCDKELSQEVRITSSGKNVAYVITDVSSKLSYYLIAWKDLNGDGELNAGDYLGHFVNTSNNTELVQPARGSFDFRLSQVE
ncbi:carboxypeptidase-like regulatory domain-containing protein [Deinococcus aquatilis]|uniref:carboxypeptidase-like regulatory domain-containing protein n=1 Tax=Deinococcus aquatilis TaxID=519440 RepID=UPI000365E86E|nr:carboxypeptidase regulatory-like domain-containing protein [Deinococcus aquatilis]